MNSVNPRALFLAATIRALTPPPPPQTRPSALGQNWIAVFGMSSTVVGVVFTGIRMKKYNDDNIFRDVSIEKRFERIIQLWRSVGKSAQRRDGYTGKKTYCVRGGHGKIQSFDFERQSNVWYYYTITHTPPPQSEKPRPWGETPSVFIIDHRFDGYGFVGTRLTRTESR